MVGFKYYFHKISLFGKVIVDFKNSFRLKDTQKLKVRFKGKTYGMDIEVFFGYPEISILNPQMRYFQKKCEIPFFQKWLFLGVWPRKLSLWKIGVMDMSYIMDSGSNSQYTTFSNIFSLISAKSADLSHNQKNHFFEKNAFFWI